MAQKQVPGSFSFMCIELYNWIVLFFSLYLFTIKEHSAWFTVCPKHKYTGPLHIFVGVNFSHCFKILLRLIFPKPGFLPYICIMYHCVFSSSFQVSLIYLWGGYSYLRDLGIKAKWLALNVKTFEVPFSYVFM